MGLNSPKQISKSCVFCVKNVAFLCGGSQTPQDRPPARPPTLWSPALLGFTAQTIWPHPSQSFSERIPRLFSLIILSRPTRKTSKVETSPSSRRTIRIQTLPDRLVWMHSRGSEFVPQVLLCGVWSFCRQSQSLREAHKLLLRCSC